MSVLYRKYAIGLVLAGLGCFALYLIVPTSPAEYCREQKRFLSDEEFIETAVRNDVKGGMMKIEPSEASIRSFHADHPKCCRVRRDVTSLVERTFGLGSVQVDLYYEVNEKTLKERPLGGEYYEVHVSIGACGRVGDWAGTRIEKRHLPLGFS